MSNIHKQAVTGIKLLMGRQVLVQFFTFGGGILLARKLDPAQFGLYAIATFLVSTFAILGDFGLAPSFIQRKSEATERELQIGFTLQQIITTTIVALLWLLAPWLIRFYPKAPHETVWLIRALAFTLYLDSWRAMSALQLERNLNYRRLAWVEVVETLSYQGIAVVMALMGYGVWSFVCATVVRGSLGAGLIFMAAPWAVRFRFDRKIAVEILRFGIPFQIANLINSFGGWVTPTIVASLIGPSAVGYLTWAASMGKKPLMLVDSVMRVSFPHFSRIQENPQEVERIMVRYLTYLLLPAGLWFALLLTDGGRAVNLIYTHKWGPAVPALVLFALAVSLDVIIWVVSVTLNAVGFVNKAAQRALIRTLAQIVLSAILVSRIGFNGVPLGYLVAMTVTLPFTFSGLRPGTMRRVLRPIGWLVLPMIGSIFVGFASAMIPTYKQIGVVLVAAVVCGIYGAITFVIGPDWLLANPKQRLRRSTEGMKIPHILAPLRKLLPVRVRVFGLRALTVLKSLKRMIQGAPLFSLEEDFQREWTERIQIMAQYIEPGEAIVDLGCGRGWLREMLPSGAVYYGCDRFPQDENTIICDFNKAEFPQLTVDVAFMSGVIEYVADWRWFLQQVTQTADKIVLSYCTTDAFPEIDERRKKGWVNNLNLEELLAFFDQMHYQTKVVANHRYGTILVATRTNKRPLPELAVKVHSPKPEIPTC